MRKGFTLIELIIVIIIVGILASVGIGQYTTVIEKGRAAEARTVLGTLRTAQAAYYSEWNAYSASIPLLGVSAPTACAGQTTNFFQYGCVAAEGVCTATRCVGATGKQPAGPSAYTKTLTALGVWGGSGTQY